MADGIVETGREERYHIVVRKYWFRQKPIFTGRLSEYERQLRTRKVVRLSFNAGNMIYMMMRRLTSVDWQKQNALIYSYRNLVYKLSYVDIRWFQKHMDVLHLFGQKNHVMWALAFITQAFPDYPLDVQTVPEDTAVQPIRYQIQNGQYVGKNARQSRLRNEDMPDVWSSEEVNRQNSYAQMPTDGLEYDPYYRPPEGALFALPDGRVAEYIGMDARFDLARQYGFKLDVEYRHNISASFIKDFEDMVRKQTTMQYDTYNIRYTALMNKAHRLEALFRGLDVSVYDILPIAERGLPPASADTVQRIDWMDHDSLKYMLDRIKNHQGEWTTKERNGLMKNAARSTIARMRGYNIEYEMYQLTQSAEDLCRVIRADRCAELYRDFAVLDSYGIVKFPPPVYRILCNDPAHGALKMTPIEREILHAFGQGYADFLAFYIQDVKTDANLRQIYQKALQRLERYYLKT